MINALQSDLAELVRRYVRLRTGIVDATAPLTVTLGAADEPYTDVKRLASYTPVIGDHVAVVLVGNDCLVLGKIV